MQPTSRSPSRAQRITGRILQGLALLFFAFDGIAKLLMIEPVIEANRQLVFPESAIAGVGALLLVCSILYAIPRTALIGAVLLTGYLGGAVAIQLRAGNPLFSHTLFPVYMGLIVWAALYLADRRVRTLLALKSA
ncbi:MAG: DoxX family protein [Rhodothermales bacterium]